MSAERPTVDVGAWARRASRETKPPTTARAVLLLLATYADRRTGECFPSQETLARDLGVSTRTIRENLGHLEARGLLSKRHRGQGRTDVYVLAVPGGAGGSDRKPASAQDRKAAVGDRKPASCQGRTPASTRTSTRTSTPSSSAVPAGQEEEEWVGEVEAMIAAYQERTDAARGPGLWASFTRSDLVDALAPAASAESVVREWIGWAETAERPQRDVVRGLRTHLARTQGRPPQMESTAEWAARQAAKRTEDDGPPVPRGAAERARLDEEWAAARAQYEARQAGTGG